MVATERLKAPCSLRFAEQMLSDILRWPKESLEDQRDRFRRLVDFFKNASDPSGQELAKVNRFMFTRISEELIRRQIDELAQVLQEIRSGHGDPTGSKRDNERGFVASDQAGTRT